MYKNNSNNKIQQINGDVSTDMLLQFENLNMPERRTQNQTITDTTKSYSIIDFSPKEILANKNILFNAIDPEEYYALTKRKSR